jgi:hypothetical protein
MVVVVLILSIKYNNSIKKDWAIAKSENTIDSYTGLIKKYPRTVIFPHSIYIDTAKIELKRLVEINDWEKAKVENTIHSYDRFINKYPDSKYTDTANLELKRLVEAQDWEKALAENTINSYDRIIKQYPGSKYSDMAETEANRLFREVIPEKPTCELNSNLSVDISWPSVTGAQHYLIYYSNYKNALLSKINKPDTTTNEFMSYWPDEFPVYYIITAVRGNVVSRPSDYCKVDLLSSQNGTKCQICGENAIGYCHNRSIYVCAVHNTYTSREGTNWRCP